MDLANIERSQYCNQTIAGLFELQVQKSPDAIAVHDGNLKYNYNELNNKANQFAQWLAKGDVKQNDFVALLMEPGADFIVSLLAIVKIGAIYVPLDTQAPQTRLESIINDFHPKILITSENYKAHLNENIHLGLINHIQFESARYSTHNFKQTADVNSPVYLMYTSGSTGVPKGILIPQAAVVNLAKRDNYADIEQGAVVGQFSNLAFDACTFEIWSALLNGAALAIIPRATRADNIELKNCLLKLKISCLFLPTGYFHQLIKSFPDTLNSVAKIIFGGEQANPALIKSFLHYRKTKQLALTLINGYGPTEATTFTCRHIITEKSIFNDEELMSIGYPIKNVKTYVLDEHGRPATEGELYISGINLALGYYEIESKNQSQFTTNPFEQEEPYKRIYKTGDRVKLLASGKLLCLGRLDDQVKIGGFRVHLNEIEKSLMRHKAISQAAVLVEVGGGAHKMLTAYLVFASKNATLDATDLRAFLGLHLPPYMLPNKYVVVDELPLTLVGKVDKKNLAKLPHTDLYFHTDTSLSSSIEEVIKKIWGYLLNRPDIDVHKNLFDLGANSLLMLDACARINDELKTDLQITQLITHPTINRLSRFIEGYDIEPAPKSNDETTASDIAIVGMSCRFPQANSVDEFWQNICQGKTCLERFTPEQLTEAEKLGDKNFVPVRGILSDIEYFDANFFGFSPIDASITDPQQRFFLECAWEAFEQAAVVPSKLGDKISVYAGMTDSTYLQENLLKNGWVQQELDRFQQRIATSMGMLSTQVSYRLNLKGRSLNINTACSTGLVTVAQACQDLRLGSCDVALAGAASIVVPQAEGYVYRQGGIESVDGFCRPFESRASGTVFSNGVGLVVLKRLEDALADNNTIFAVIKGVGINNDGSDKLGYTAPGVHGQTECIREALSNAKIKADQLGYLEAHGTATALGDAVEVEALSTIFREQTANKQYCALGSVKGNIGHTDVASGVAGLIKTALCLFHKKIPPMPLFENYNPHINFAESPFFINRQLMDWQCETNELYAGLSSFGVGGTNVHMVLGEPGPISSAKESSNENLIILSAKTEDALEQHIDKLNGFLKTSDLNTADIAYTLQTGREAFPWRSFCVAKNNPKIIERLSVSKPVFCDIGSHPNVIFMFPGQGTQYHKMVSELMMEIPFFASLVKQGISIATKYLDLNLLEIINNPYDERLNQTQYAQPALFIVEYALAKLLIHYGIKPTALIGHSLGEYAAACVAGVFSFEDALALICQRGFLMADVSPGEMLAIECTKEELVFYLQQVELALQNAINQFVVSGTAAEISKLEKILLKEKKLFHRLKVSHAFHSRSMDEIEQPFKNLFANFTLSAPNIPMISNVSGAWLSAKEATEPDYWYSHLRHTVQFSKGIETLLEDSHSLFIEVGPGQSLNTFLKEIAHHHQKKVFSTQVLEVNHSQVGEFNQFLTAIGQVWQQGVEINWQALHENTVPGHVPLPTYSFQKQRYWIEPSFSAIHEVACSPKIYIPSWHRQKIYNESVLLTSVDFSWHSWIIFEDFSGLSKKIISLLEKKKIEPIIVTNDNNYSQENSRHYKINLRNKKDYSNLFQDIKEKIKNPIILHLSSYTDTFKSFPTRNEIDEQLSLSFFSFLYLTQAYIEELGNKDPLKIGLITAGSQYVLGTEKINPINATLVGSCRVVMQEHTKFKCRLFDLDPTDGSQNDINLLNKIFESCLNDDWAEENLVVSYRNNYQWHLVHNIVTPAKRNINRLKDNGVYVLTGGLGGIALNYCEAIARVVSNPTFILLSRKALPNEKDWLIIVNNPDHSLCKKIEQLINLKKLGASIVFYQVDISQYQPLEAVIEKCVSRFGEVNGLIHTAGISNSDLIEFKSKAVAQDVFSAKIYGTYNLAKSFKKYSLDFVILTSSLAALLGGYQQIDYSGANSCLDAFADSELFPPGSFVVSINWNTWREVGIAAEADLKGEATFLGKGNDISPQQGRALFLKILQGNDGHVAISNSDINFKITPQSGLLTKQFAPHIKTARHNIKSTTEYLSPTNELESKLAQLWQDSLGIETIGINDNFFNLGGNSLNALNLIEKINKNFNCNLPATQLYRDPTVKQLSLSVLSHGEAFLPHAPVLLKRKRNNAPYLFLCHPIGGLINCFHSFISQSKLTFSIYGIQDPSIEDNKIIYSNLDSMAEDYLFKIQQIQPVGPYYLVGYSFGGNIFFEVANKLLKQGHKVQLLALIDSWALIPPTLQNEVSFKRIFRSTSGLSDGLINLSWKREQLLINYLPSKTDQEILLFKASHLSDDYKDIEHPTNGWSKHNKGKIIAHTINSNHADILNSEHSKIILKLIEQYLRDNLRTANEIFEKCSD